MELDEKRFIEQALANRMEIIELEQHLAIDDLNIELTKNGLLPNLTFRYTYKTETQDSDFSKAFNYLSVDSYDDHSI